MDNAVALVQAYLHVNGYFTVAEYPILEVLKHAGYRSVTDLDILAFRFPNAGRVVRSAGNKSSSYVAEEAYVPDPALGIAGDQTDMLIGEVKEGTAQMNVGATNPMAVEAALVRFGCCAFTDAQEVARTLLRKGHITLPASGHNLRMVAFGSVKDGDNSAYRTISLGHVARFLQGYIRQHWEFVRHAQFKDPVFGFLVTLEKAMQGAE